MHPHPVPHRDCAIFYISISIYIFFYSSVLSRGVCVVLELQLGVALLPKPNFPSGAIKYIVAYKHFISAALMDN